MKGIMSIIGPEGAYKSMKENVSAQSSSTGFSKVLGDVLADTAKSIHTNEAEMRAQALGFGGDMTQLTFNTAELANKVKIVSNVVQKVAGTWNDLTKMQI